MTDTFDFSGDAYRPSIEIDPDAILDYTFDWTDWLDGVSDIFDTMPVPPPVVITASNITIDSFDVSGKKIIVWLSSAICDKGTVSCTCQIRTAAGRTEQRTMYFTVIQR